MKSLFGRSLLLIAGMMVFISCSTTTRTTSTEQVLIEAQENPVPGTVKDVWAEPMYDTVRVPGQIDPTNTYYRLPHKTVVEIRQHRFQRQQFPQDSKTGE